MTLRIEPELLERLREVAKAERRSVSAQVLHVVRRELADRPSPRRRPLATLGWLRHLDAPDRLEEFRRLRRALSRRVAAHVGQHRKGR